MNFPTPTAEQKKRIIQAIAETQYQIDREMKYQPQFRKTDNIERWQKHIEKLNAMLNA